MNCSRSLGILIVSCDNKDMTYNQGENNPMFGKKHSEETREKMRLKALGKNNVMWKGNEVKIDALHHWVKRHLPKPELCEYCHETKPYDLANITGNYNRDFNNWKYLCRKCHMLSDGRMNNLAQNLSPEQRSENTRRAWIKRRAML